jgi:hypothetical protein
MVRAPNARAGPVSSIDCMAASGVYGQDLVKPEAAAGGGRRPGLRRAWPWTTLDSRSGTPLTQSPNSTYPPRFGSRRCMIRPHRLVPGAEAEQFIGDNSTELSEIGAYASDFEQPGEPPPNFSGQSRPRCRMPLLLQAGRGCALFAMPRRRGTGRLTRLLSNRSSLSPPLMMVLIDSLPHQPA